jgi:CRP-like cAMP-binding protein
VEDKIIRFISSYVSLSEEEIGVITAQNLIRSYKKEEVILSEGELAKVCYFVIKGCIRSYYLVDGEERNTEFYTENQAINPVSYIRNEPSAYYLSCLEDCIVAVGSAERNTQLLEKVPKLASLVMRLNSEMIVENQVALGDLRTLSPEMRYRKLLEKRPDLFGRIPLYHLATYLGITPVSLSRMRRRILSKEAGPGE